VPLSYISSPSVRPAKKQRPGRSQSDDEGSDLAEDGDNYISIEDALRLVRDDSVPTRAPSKVEDAVWGRILQ